MASSNPAFANSPAFNGRGDVAARVNTPSADELDALYSRPSATPTDTGRMTYEDTIVKTVSLFAILLVGAAVGWFVPGLFIVGAIGGFILALVNTFKRQPSAGLIIAYAAFEGLFVGGISAFFEVIWPGIVMQATLATVAVVGVTLALFASGKVRASKKMTKIVMIAMLGYLVFSLLNIVLMFTGVLPEGQQFGLLSQQVMGIPLGVIIGVLVVFMAAYSLVMDFDQIQQGVRNGAPRKYGWLGGFGIMVTVVWLYVEILRIIAIARGSN